MADNEEKLVKMLKYVSEHNDFYKKRIKEYGITNPLDITQWPILTRKELQENRYNMFSDGYKSKYFNQQLRRQASSGSTGVPVNVYWDYRDWYASNMSLWRKRWRWYGIKPGDKYISFELQSADNSTTEGVQYANASKNVLNINVSCIYGLNQFKSILTLIDKFEPKWLYIRPFVLRKIIDCYILFDCAPPKSLTLIETHGEILTNDLKTRAVEFFKVPISNMYGSEEMNGIAYECPNHCLHILQDNVFVEIIADKSRPNASNSDIIITNLHNKAMPLIRYQQGDTVVLKNGSTYQCDCQSCSPRISIIEGRSSDYIELDDEYILNSVLFLEIMGMVNNYFGGVISFYKFSYFKSKSFLLCETSVLPQYSDWFLRIKQMIYQLFCLKIPDHLSINLSVKKVDDFSFFGKKHRIFEVKE